MKETKNGFQCKFLQFMKWKNISWGNYEVKRKENGHLLHIWGKSYDMKYSIVSAIIPGVSSVVRPNTPLHDQEQGEVTAGTATSHTASQGRSRRFGRHGEHWTQPPASWWVHWSLHSLYSVIADWAGLGVGKSFVMDYINIQFVLLWTL